MHFDINDIVDKAPFSMDKACKEQMLSSALSALTVHHYDNCTEYKKVLDAINYSPYEVHKSCEIPMIPVRLFKEYELISVPKNKVVKTMTSSGTSGQAVSKIFLDKENTRNQTKILNNIIASFIGKKRLPLLILDTEQVKTNRAMFSARGAGIIGFSMFGRDTLFVLDENMKLNIPTLQAFLERHQGETILMFGYTYLIWQYIICELKNANINFGVENGILFHIGGWKKLKDQAVDSVTFNKNVCQVMGNIQVYNYYGMAEQLGSVFVECEHGHMHCSIFSDVIIRRPKDFSMAKVGERGLIELVSVLPTSYPGHALLTEDEGEILGEDDCPCGRLGKYFKINGRIKGAELRGCSDTYERR